MLKNLAWKTIAFSFLFLTAWTPCTASESLCVVTEDWIPYNYTENGTVTGVVTEVVRAVLDRTGLPYSIKSYPWARAYNMAQKQPNTLIYSIIKLPERAPLFKWVKIDGMSVDMYLFSPKGRDDIELKNLEDAKKYKVGVTRETSTHHFLLARGFKDGANLFPVNTEEQNMLRAELSRRWIDLSTGDRLSMAAWLKKAGFPPDYWRRELLLFQEDIYMALSPSTSDEIVERIRTAFQEIKTDGTLGEIIEKYDRLLAHRDNGN